MISPNILAQLRHFLLLLITSTIIIVFIYFNYSQSPINSDFRSFFAAAQILIHEPHQLYDLPTQYRYQQLPHLPQNEFLPYVNPPFYLIPHLLLTSLPIQTAYTLTRLATVILILLTLYLLIKIFPTTSIFTKLLLSLSFTPLYSTIINTQNSGFSLLLFTLIYLTSSSQKFFLTGLLLSLLLIKPQLLIIILPYLAYRHPKTLLPGFLIGTCVLLLISLYLTPNLFSAYPSILKWYALVHDNQSEINLKYLSLSGLFSQINTYFYPLPFNLFARLTSLLLIIYTLIKTTSSLPRQFSIIIISTLLTATHVNHPEALLLLFPYFYYAQTPTASQQILTLLGWIIFLVTLFVPQSPHHLPFIAPLYLLLLLFYVHQPPPPSISIHASPTH